MTCKWGVHNDPIFEIHDAYLPIHNMRILRCVAVGSNSTTVAPEATEPADVQVSSISISSDYENIGNRTHSFLKTAVELTQTDCR